MFILLCSRHFALPGYELLIFNTDYKNIFFLIKHFQTMLNHTIFNKIITFLLNSPYSAIRAPKLEDHLRQYHHKDGVGGTRTVSGAHPFVLCEMEAEHCEHDCALHQGQHHQPQLCRPRLDSSHPLLCQSPSVDRGQ